jgi:hypothetical protein
MLICQALDRTRTFFNGGKKLYGKNGKKNLELGIPAAKPRKFFGRLIPNFMVKNPNLANFYVESGIATA